MIINSKFITVVFPLFILSGCGAGDRNSIVTTDSFPLKIELNSTAIDIPVTLLYPTGICITDNKLIVLDRGQEELFKIFKLPEISYLSAPGNIGKGPDEFTTIDENYFKVTNNELELVDNGMLKRLSFSDDGFTIKQVIRLPRLQNPINRLQRINDSIYMSDNIMTDGEFEHLLINVNTGKIVKKFGKYPNDGLDIKNNNEKYQIYVKQTTSSPDGEKLVVFYTYFNRLRIYDNNGELQKSINLNDVKVRRFSVENRANNPLIFFAQPVATDRFIYSLRLNVSEEELIQSPNDYKTELLIWDWNGNPKAQCKLDRLITSFAISEKHKKIYGVSLMGGNEIFVYNLPEI